MATARGSGARGPAKPTKGGSRTPDRYVTPEELEPSPVVLITGTEDLLGERAVAAVLAKVRAADPEIEIDRLEAATYSSGILAVATSPSLFGGAKVVVVSGVEGLNEAFLTDALAYVKSPDPDAVVILRHSGGVRGKALLEAARAARAPEVSCQPLTRDEEKIEFVAAEFRRLARRVTPAAVRALVDAVGTDLRELAASCSQIASDTPPPAPGAQDRIDVDVIERYFGGRIEVTGFKVADAAVAGRAEEALGLLRHAVATGLDPVPLVAVVALKVRGLAKVFAAAGGRGRSADLARELGMAPWQVDRARRDLVGWDDTALTTAILAVAEADAAVKGGGRDPVYAVERLVLTVAAQRQ